MPPFFLSFFATFYSFLSNFRLLLIKERFRRHNDDRYQILYFYIQMNDDETIFIMKPDGKHVRNQMNIVLFLEKSCH